MSPIWNCSNGTDQYELRLRRAIRARSDAQSAYLRCLGELQVWARATVLESQGCWLGVISGKARPEHLLSAFPPKADFARSLRDVRLECAPEGGQFQAAFLTDCWAWWSSYCTGLR